MPTMRIKEEGQHTYSLQCNSYLTVRESSKEKVIDNMTPERAAVWNEGQRQGKGNHDGGRWCTG